MKVLNTIGWIFSIIVIDIVLYLGIGLVIMSYEDFYDESKGEYFSLGSMTILEKTAYIGYYILIILNIILVTYVAYSLINKYLRR